MKTEFDVVIIGGGLNGAVMSLALAHSGFSVAVVDALAPETTSQTEFDGRAYALALGSIKLLRALGVWSLVEDTAQPMRAIKASDGRAGEGAGPWFLHFDSNETEDGPMGYVLEDRFLRRALHSCVIGNEHITLFHSTKASTHSNVKGGVSVTLTTGTELVGTLLIAADGRHSETAARAGIRRHGWSYGQHAITCAVAHEAPHNAIAHQFFMPGGPLAILPLPGRKSSIVWSDQSDTIDVLLALDDAAFLRRLQPAFGKFLGEISLAGPRFSYPLRLSLAETMIADRLALVGDAAHGVHPLAGQGLNAGLKDIAVLTDVLVDARARGEDIGTEQVLSRYKSWRQFDVAILVAATDGFNRLFSNDNPILRAARGAGMGLVGSLPMLRRGFMREAAGVTGDLPSLMR